MHIRGGRYGIVIGSNYSARPYHHRREKACHYVLCRASGAEKAPDYIRKSLRGRSRAGSELSDHRAGSVYDADAEGFGDDASAAGDHEH